MHTMTNCWPTENQSIFVWGKINGNDFIFYGDSVSLLFFAVEIFLWEFIETPFFLSRYRKRQIKREI